MLTKLIAILILLLVSGLCIVVGSFIPPYLSIVINILVITGTLRYVIPKILSRKPKYNVVDFNKSHYETKDS